MSAGDLAVTLAALLCAIGFAALIVVLMRVLDTLKALRVEVESLRRETGPLLVDLRTSTDEARDAMDIAREDLERFDRVRRAVKFPLYGGDCYAYGLVASGFADLVVEAGLSAYDWAALVPVLEGAGGRCTDWRGNALDLATPKSRIIAAGDSRVHRAGVEILSS